MIKLFGVLLFSFLATLLAAIPFINLLYRLKFLRQKEKKEDVLGEENSLVNKLHAWKVGTPNAGGLLIVIVTIILSAFFYQFTKYKVNLTALVLYFTLVSFGLLGFYDDIHKFVGHKKGTYGLRMRYKLLLQIALGLGIGWVLYNKMFIETISLPLVGALNLGPYYMAYAALVIVASSNAVNITDGLDGLATGLVIIALSVFWVLNTWFGLADVSVFIAVIIGSLLAFLYFNIFPARVWLGDTGALSLGAMIAVIALLINQTFPLLFIGGIFVLEAASSLLQILSKQLGGEKIFIAAPFHHHLEAKGWDEAKIVMRFWLAGAVFAFLGLFASLISR